MKKRILILYLFCFSITMTVVAQTPIKDMQGQMLENVAKTKKQIADLEKKIADAKTNKEDPAIIKMMEDQLPMLKEMLATLQDFNKDILKTPDNTVKQTVVKDNNDDIPKFPRRDPSALETMPKISSQTALRNYVSDLHNQFLKRINRELVASFKQIETKLENDANKMEAAAISAWYSDAPSQSILLITKAAAKPGASDLTMSNLGAILNLGGVEKKSVPILRWLVNIYPQNAMILNNVGQAYTGLGELDSAMVYFGRCLAIEPNHPQANNTAGEIELSRGNQAAAIQHFKNSLKGAFTEEATRRVRFVEPEMDINDYVRHNIHIPEYFNESKYNVPAQCQNVSEAETMTGVYNGYTEMLGNLYGKYKALIPQYQEKTTKYFIKRSNDASAGKNLTLRPFIIKGICGWDALMKKYQSDLEWLGVMDKDYEKAKKELDEKFSTTYPDKGSCAAQVAHINQYKRDFADITIAWQLKHTAFSKKYINQIIYWSFLNSHSNDEFKLKFYTWVNNYLNEMSKIATTDLQGPPLSCGEMQQLTIPAEEIEIIEPDCPINLELKLIVGKIKLNCDKFEISGGEGATFKYEKNFRSKQSTFSVGIGVTFELSKGFGGGYEGSISVNAGESVFITLDGNNSFSDLGLSVYAKASIGVEKSSKMEVGEIVKEISNKRDVIGAEAGAGYTVGINSGWTFYGGTSVNTGPLGSILTIIN